MEFVAQAQALIAENAMYVGIGLFLVFLLAGFMWYSMSRGSAGGKDVLENQARMNMATTDVPSGSSQPDPVAPPPQMSQEELEKQIANIGNMDSLNAKEE
jgi:hypothetical protein